MSHAKKKKKKRKAGRYSEHRLTEKSEKKKIKSRTLYGMDAFPFLKIPNHFPFLKFEFPDFLSIKNSEFMGTDNTLVFTIKLYRFLNILFVKFSYVCLS